MAQVTSKNFNVTGTAEQIAQLNLSLAYLQSSFNYSNVANASVENGGVRNIKLTDSWVTPTYDYATKTITWNPNMSFVVKNGDTTGVMSPAAVLGHELAHGADSNFANENSAQREATVCVC